MKASRFFASTVTAAAVAGAIGFAYAQTATQDGTRTQPQPQYQSSTPSQTGPATVNPNLEVQRQGGSASDMNRDSRSTTRSGGMNDSTTGMSGSSTTRANRNRSNDSGNMPNERLARADRN